MVQTKECISHPSVIGSMILITLPYIYLFPFAGRGQNRKMSLNKMYYGITTDKLNIFIWFRGEGIYPPNTPLWLRSWMGIIWLIPSLAMYLTQTLSQISTRQCEIGVGNTTVFFKFKINVLINQILSQDVYSRMGCIDSRDDLQGNDTLVAADFKTKVCCLDKGS